MNITFDIPGRIRGKGRPQFVRKTGIAYTPASTRNAEAMIRSLAMDAMDGHAPFTGPLELSVCIRIMYPKSWPQKRRLATVFVTGKPDLDNQIKILGDSCNGIIWLDDSQIAQLGVVRLYTPDGPERATIRVSALGAAQAMAA